MCPIAIDLFSGVGGTSLGLQAAGFEIKAGLEFDPVQAATHLYNFPTSKIICEDIREFDPASLNLDRKIDLISFSAPCQGFSMAGKRDAKDPRSQLSFEALRIILKLRPKYFVAENVPAIAYGKSALILEQLHE